MEGAAEDASARAQAESEEAARAQRQREEAAALAAAEAAREQAARAQRLREEEEAASALAAARAAAAAASAKAAAAAAADAARAQEVAAVLQGLVAAVEVQAAAEEREEERLRALMREHLVSAGWAVSDLKDATRALEDDAGSAAAAKALLKACAGLAQQCSSGGSGGCAALLASGALPALQALLRCFRSLGASRDAALAGPVEEHSAALRAASHAAQAAEERAEALEALRVAQAKGYPGKAAQEAARRLQLETAGEVSRLEELLAAAKQALAASVREARAGPRRVLEGALGALAALVGAAEAAQARAVAVEVLPTLRRLEAEWKDYGVAWPLLHSASLPGGQQGLVAALAALGGM